jgi:predicted AAA+ superfamily ATPase
MDLHDVNVALGEGDIDSPCVLPKLEELRECPCVLEVNFGLDELPQQPGVILVRGARQYGKSTWLQQQIARTIEMFGPGTAFYVDGDELRDGSVLIETIRSLLPLYAAKAPVRRLFIDEITAIEDWQTALKRLLDRGELKRVLVVTTGSKAADLRHGSERLPGRKGALSRTSYIFVPVAFSEFKRVSEKSLKARDVLPAYLLSGGSPCACTSLVAHGHLPDHVVEMVRDWVYGEVSASGRSRPMMVGVMDCLMRFAGTPVGQSKLAREAGLANNTVAAGYIELLSDLMCVASSFAWDEAHRRPNRRRPCKFHLSNLLAASAWHPSRPRRAGNFHALPEPEQGALLEWLVAQELFRRAALRGDEFPEVMSFWQSGEHEIDFVLGDQTFVEVKRGKTSPLDFAWFPRCFPKGHLTVVSDSRYETDRIRGVTPDEFLSMGQP